MKETVGCGRVMNEAEDGGVIARYVDILTDAVVLTDREGVTIADQCLVDGLVIASLSSRSIHCSVECPAGYTTDEGETIG